MSDTDPASSRPDTPGETDAGSAPPPTPTDQPIPSAPTPSPQYNPTPPLVPSSPESPDEPVSTPPTPVAPPPYRPAPEEAEATPPITPAAGDDHSDDDDDRHDNHDDDDDDDDDRHDNHDDDDDDDDDDWDEIPARDQQALRWVGMVTSVGVGIVSVIALQVLISLYEGLSFKAGERIQSVEFPSVTDDLLHRIGYAFAGLGTTSQIFLIVAVVLISLPPVLGGRLTDKQYRNTGIALRVATVLAITVAVGTLLWVRASLNEYSVKDVAVPRFVRIEYTNALLGTLTASALAIFASLTAHPLREWDR